ncbi:MAG: 3-methyl-2-oxobutanoate hydroxymethyltransferase [Gammaproteobacteria bacterium]
MKNFAAMKKSGEKIAALTAYDSSFAKLAMQAGADALLVGDSLGMVLQGRGDTLAVTMRQMIYHIQCAAAGAPDAFIIGDMPFASYQQSPVQCYANAAKLLAAGASMVKVEGGAELADTVRFVCRRGIAVCAHIGLMPQRARKEGGYKVHGKTEPEAAAVMEDAEALADAGAELMIVELLPRQLAAKVSAKVATPTIGIGSGPECDGQILVLHDMLGIGKPKKFVRDFMDGAGGILAAMQSYVAAVKSGDFPAAQHSF